MSFEIVGSPTIVPRADQNITGTRAFRVPLNAEPDSELIDCLQQGQEVPAIRNVSGAGEALLVEVVNEAINDLGTVFTAFEAMLKRADEQVRSAREAAATEAKEQRRRSEATDAQIMKQTEEWWRSRQSG